MTKNRTVPFYSVPFYSFYSKRYKSLYLPAMTIVAAVLLLLLVIAISTYRNINRERGRMEESLMREGRVLIHALEAAVKANFPSDAPDIGRLNKLLADISRDPEIAGISLIDQEGRLVAYSSLQETGKKIGGASLNLLLQEKGMVTRYGRDAAGEGIFEIVRPFRPFFSANPLASLPERGEAERWAKEPLMKWSQDKIVILSFRLRAFETAKQADLHHVYLMVAILIVLGMGTLYFIFIVQNYYLVDRTLDRIRTYMENVVDSMADGLISLDKDGQVVTMNRQASEILGAEAEGLRGKAIADIMGGGKGTFLMGERGLIIRDRKMEITGRNGVSMPVSLSAAPLKDEMGGEIGSVILIRDMREIRELEEKVRRSERMASLGRLSAGIAHEIRNPLSSIRGFAQFFLSHFKGQKTEEEYASIMVSEVDRLNRVITELLDFARPKEPRREPCSIEDIINYTLKVLSAELEKRKVTVERKWEGELPPMAADREQISQAFLNLFLNARDAVEEGGKIIVAMQYNSVRSALDISIADTGRGIPAGELERIFEPFFSTKRKGTGLGLAIVHQIIEMHGGEIRAENAAGGGAVFKISLPLQ